MPELKLSDIVGRLGGDLRGDPQRVMRRIATLEAAEGDAIAFLANPRYQSQLAATRAGCVIVAPAQADAVPGAAIVTPDPYRYYARLTQWWAALQRPSPPPGVHALACVAADAVVDPSASIAAYAYVGPGARIGAHAVIGTHVHIGDQAEVGEGTRLAPRVTLGERCRIGARGIVHSGVVIGADGFGFAPADGGWDKIEQLGAVRIGDDVEIGANTCIDRGALDDTVIEDGVKLDNLIQIGHNVRIGAHTVMAGCAAVAGSTRIGRHCQIAGDAKIIGHLEIADHVVITVCTVVTRSILKPGVYSGAFPFDDNAAWEKNAATLRQLHALRERVRALEKKTP
jgi:UDP-3-O-[3-hydroxymyristoyl] glucosamine N-acyltransferase